MSRPEQSGRRGSRSVTLGLRALRHLAANDTLDRAGLRKGLERTVFHSTKAGLRSARVSTRALRAARDPRKRRGDLDDRRGDLDLFDVTPDEEQALIQQTIREYAAAQVRPAASTADAAACTPDALLAQLDELGLSMVGVPEQLGGTMHAQAAVTAVLVGEALAHGDMGIAYAALAPGAVATAIARWGTPAQQASYLPAFSGAQTPAAALAVLEPAPLFDPERLRTRARRSRGAWTLDGTKSLVARAGDCSLLLVAAEAAGIGPALFLVESPARGLTVEPEPAMGLRAAATGRLLLRGVRAPDSALLGAAPSAVYGDCVQRARIAWCALAVGCAQAVLDYVIPYVKERVAFGEPIANRQAVAFAVSDMAVESAGMRLASYRAASLADSGGDFARAAALARTLCAEHSMRIGSQGVQLLGGHGFTTEHPVERWFRDLRAAGVMEGALLV